MVGNVDEFSIVKFFFIITYRPENKETQPAFLTQTELEDENRNKFPSIPSTSAPQLSGLKTWRNLGATANIVLL